jgi:hypothetical protein
MREPDALPVMPLNGLLQGQAGGAGAVGSRLLCDGRLALDVLRSLVMG